MNTTNDKNDLIPLDIPKGARALMLVIGAIEAIGIPVYYKIMVMNGDHSDSVLFHAFVFLATFPITMALIGVPGVLGYYPRWVVRMFSRRFLERLISEADVLWQSSFNRSK